MLPAAAVFHFPWEVTSGAVQEGESVRTFGSWMFELHCAEFDTRRLLSVHLLGGEGFSMLTDNPEESRATLSAQHASKEHQVVVSTLFVEPFNPIIGAQYVVLGEKENTEGGDVMVRARVLNCVDGVNVALLQKAINEQRSFFRERENKQGDAAQAADVT